MARVQWFPLFGIAIWVIAMRWRLALALLREVNPFLLLSMSWIALSTFWSYTPDVTVRREKSRVIVRKVKRAIRGNEPVK